MKINKKDYLLDKIDRSWNDFFNNFGWDKISLILERVEKNDFLPRKEDVFRLFREISIDKIKVVILGQDPYHQEGVADGFAFSTRNFVKPASLKNIFIELEKDEGIKASRNSLHLWVEQGIFLLNTCLTVEKSKPLSHKEHWSKFSEFLLSYLKSRKKDIIWVFWGKSAKNFGEVCKIEKKYTIASTHPSPFSASFGFFNSKPFSKINNLLILQKKNKINWET